MAIIATSRPGITEPKSYTTLAVQYRDGLTLNYIFVKVTQIADLMAAISRAGLVQKVVLRDEMPRLGQVPQTAASQTAVRRGVR